MRCELELDERRLLTHPADLDPLGLDVDRPRKDALGSEPGAQESNMVDSVEQRHDDGLTE